MKGGAQGPERICVFFLENTELSRVVGFIFHHSKGKSCIRRHDTSYKEMIGQNPRPKVNGTRIFVLFFLLAKFWILGSRTPIPRFPGNVCYTFRFKFLTQKRRVLFIVSLNLKLTGLDILLIETFENMLRVQ